MTTVSCIVVTTLVVVSLANLVLLVHVIMNSIYKCNQNRTYLKRIAKIQKREDSSFQDQEFKVTTNNFVAALIVEIDGDSFEFVCGVAIVGKKWALTPAHCVDSIIDQPRIKTKVSSNTLKLKYGIWYDIDKMIKHQNYKPNQHVNDVALISVKQPFKEKEVKSVILPTKNYLYVAESTATAVGWVSQEVFAIDLKLLPHKHCQSVYLEGITNGTFCAEKKACVYDHGGFLIQKGVLIGTVSFGIGCTSKPIVYTKISLFENWFKHQKIGAVFKGST
ncbi:trypsin V-A-like [Tribolium madens]|uniref:trypsin V-A-like n=1 Tax=Tribolium madens TaxID=41895 RepID=UPI001CF73642|nr:trypsin V-A-like [Tribolium madens]